MLPVSGIQIFPFLAMDHRYRNCLPEQWDIIEKLLQSISVELIWMKNARSLN